MSALEDLAAYIAGLNSDAVAVSVAEKLRLHVADIIGAWIAATATPEGRALIAFHQSQAADDIADKVALHCALARLSELDDIHLASMTTPGSIAMPAALLLASSLPDADDIAAAILAGYEAMIRFGEAIDGPKVLYRGIWPTYFAAGLGTAAVAARLMRLDAKQTAQALALALSSAAPSVGQHHAPTTARWLSVGMAARNGVAAAHAARAGFTADINALDGRLLPDVFGIQPNLAKLAAANKPRFAHVSLKPWCAARQTMAATQALRELLADGVAPADIVKIEAAVPPPHLKMIDHGVRPGDRASYVTSLPYQMAVAALKPERRFDLTPPTSPPDEATLNFMARISVEGDDALLGDYPAAWPARVAVTTAKGRQEKHVRHVPGDPLRPFPAVDVEGKFMRVVEPVVGTETAHGLFSLQPLKSAGAREQMLRVLSDLTRRA